MNDIFHYYVEGENEAKLVELLSNKLFHIVSGRIEVFNVVEKRLKPSHVRKLNPQTTVVLIFDTDTGNTGILSRNLFFLRQQSNVKEVLCIPQVRNLEEELVRSCRSLGDITRLLGSTSCRNFKGDFNRCKNLEVYLKKVDFFFPLLWSSKPEGEFCFVSSDIEKIRRQVGVYAPT